MQSDTNKRLYKMNCLLFHCTACTPLQINVICGELVLNRRLHASQERTRMKLKQLRTFPLISCPPWGFTVNLKWRLVWSVLIMSWPWGKMTWPGSVALSMIGECRWVLRCFPYRHWTSSPPLKAAAAASPDTSCTEPQFSQQATACRREGETRWGKSDCFVFIYHT